MQRREGSIQRRRFLRGLGGVALAVPFLSSLREARGEDPTPPRRLVFFYTMNGCITDKWWPELEDGELTADTFAGTTLEVLAPHYRKLLLPRGFRSLNEYARAQTIDPHDQAMGSKLTCAAIQDTRERYAEAESLDHTVAKQINRGGVLPLVLSVGRASMHIRDVVSFSGPGVAHPARTSPESVYRELVGLVHGNDGEADYRLRRGESVIDIVADDLLELKRHDMSSADEKQLDAWLNLLRDTEVGMGTPAACSPETEERLGITTATLSEASAVPVADDPDAHAEWLATAFTKGADMMMNLMALTMICDANRALILSFPGYVVFNWDGIAHRYDHGGLSHRTGDLTVGGNCNPANVMEQLLEIDRWYAKKFERLVGLFDGIEEGEGTLLDNTATVWLHELSDGAAHNLNNLPILIAGGAGGYLVQGRAVNVEGKPISRGNSSQSCNGENSASGMWGSSGGEVPINKLYVTLMNAVGCTEDGTPTGGKVQKFGVFDGFEVDSGISQPGEVPTLVAQS